MDASKVLAVYVKVFSGKKNRSVFIYCVEKKIPQVLKD